MTKVWFNKNLLCGTLLSILHTLYILILTNTLSDIFYYYHYDPFTDKETEVL